MLTPADLDATCINTAMKRLNTDEAALIEVIISRNNEELQAMKISFKKCKFFFFYILNCQLQGIQCLI